tara:strand:+ start:28253 stop:29026 length:774 start_codon:yes stop_codon:yes gene_type:complete
MSDENLSFTDYFFERITTYFIQLVLRLLVFALVLVSLVSCESDDNSASGGKGISQGTIVYNVTYPYLDSNDIGLNLLPQSMELTFKDGFYRVESVGGMGLFVAGYVSNNKEKKMDYFLKVISSKFVSRFNEKGVKKLHKDFPSYQLKKLDSTRVIAGYECQGYRVSYYSNIVQDHNVWVTRDINIPGMNWCSPFPKVKGVMLGYQVQRSGLVIDFSADVVRNDSISMESFKIPIKYKVISNKALVRKMEEAFIGFDY